MERGVIDGILENRSRKKNSGTDGGASGAGIDFERAAELRHSFTHAWDAYAEARLAAVGSAVCRDDHATAEVGDFKSDALRVFPEDDLGALAAGMTLDVGETFLSDAEECGFGDLRETAKASQKLKRGFDAAAFAETVDVFLEGGDEAEVVEQRRMKEIRERANFAGHLLEEFTC